MAELVAPNQKVRDLVSAPRRLPIEIEGSVAYEVLLTIWSAMNGPETNTAFDLGPEWQQEVTDSIAPELRDELVTLGGPYSFAWLGISSLLMSAPHPHSPDRVFSWLSDIEERRLRRWLLGYASESPDQALIEQVASGDLDGLTDLLGDKAAHKPEVVEFLRWVIDNEGLPARYAGAVRRFRAEVFAEYEDDFSGAIGRAAAARRAAPARGDAKAVVEEVTSGIEFDIPLGVERVILVPSVVTRPLSLIDGHRGTLIVYYGVADEFINGDPEAPPSWLVRAYKALSDDRRLRILRRLSEGSTSLDELTDMLGLSKSTVHHHMSLLRGAGLVRIHMSSEETKGKQKHYSLREQSLADVNGFLDSYLRTSDQEELDA